MFLNCKYAVLFVLLLKSKYTKPNIKESEGKILMNVFFGNSSFLAYSGRREEILEIREF